MFIQKNIPPPSERTLLIIDRIIFGLLIMFLFCSAFSIALSEIGYFVALAVSLFRMVYVWKFGFEKSSLDLYFAGYLVAEVLATIFADHKLYSLMYLQKRMLLLPIVYVVLSNTTTRHRLGWLVGALLGSSIATSLWSFHDVFLHFQEYLHLQRRLGEFQIYMTAGGIMMITLLLVLPFLIHPGTPKKIRWILGCAALPLAINLYFTFTRSSWLGLLGGILVIAGVRSKKILVPVGILSVVVFLLAPLEVKERVYSIVDPSHPSNVGRVNMWNTGLRVVQDHPLFGIGDVGTETIWNQYSDPGWEWEGHLHNNIIMWLVTLGAFGFAILVALFTKLWLVAWNTQRTLRDDWLGSSLAVGMLAVLVGFHINGLFEWNFGDTEIITIVWALTGLTLAAQRLASKEQVAHT